MKKRTIFLLLIISFAAGFYSAKKNLIGIDEFTIG